MEWSVSQVFTCPLPTDNTELDFVLPDGHLSLGISGYSLDADKKPLTLKFLEGTRC